MVGVLDTAFQLTDEEVFFTSEIIRKLLVALRIPERGRAEQLPALVAYEAESGLYSLQISEGRSSGVRRPRLANHRDSVVTLEAWRQGLLGLITAAYPNLDPLEVTVASEVLDELLTGLGLPQRAALYVPDDVVRAHLQGA